jgi:cytochrome c oxidase subunit 2
MAPHPRSRRVLGAALLAGFLLAATACTQDVPNSTLVPNSEFGRDIDHLFNILFIGGAIVFVLVEAGLLYTIFRYRHREGAPQPKQVHGNTALEITWTLIPALVLAFIAVPTVRTIFRTQAPAAPDALQVEVIGHQWWWEFRYPESGVVTANELYLPTGRTVNFALKSQDVIHSFWIPAVAGKRDLITNRTNYLWFTPDDTTGAWNGFCAEYCGASHANMRFRVFTVPPAQFEAWLAHQKSGPAFSAPAVPGAPAATPAAPAATAAAPADSAQAQPAAQPGTPAATQPATATFAINQLPRHSLPSTPLPAGLDLSVASGDAARGAQLYRTSACIACHKVEGVSPGIIGPNLTHVGSRTTIAAGLYPNDFAHLARWIKNAPAMKPGSLMPALGKSDTAPGGYTDQQVADLAAYLLSLK